MRFFSGVQCFTISLLALNTLLVGCASTEADQKSAANQLPEWVLNPVVEGGLAAAECVKFSGNISVDQKMVIANARASLAQQIDSKVKAMDKTYAHRTDSQDASDTGSTFESVSKQIANQSLAGSRAKKFAMTQINGVDHYCGLVTLTEQDTKLLFNNIVAQSKANISAQDEAFLYEEFRAQKAQDELEKELSEQSAP